MITKFDSLFLAISIWTMSATAGIPVNYRRFPTNISPPSSTRRGDGETDGSAGLRYVLDGRDHFQHEGYECIPNVLMTALHLAHLTERLAWLWL